MQGEFYGGTPIDVASDEGFHWIVSDATDTVGPYGQAGTYTLAASTDPTGIAPHGIGRLDTLSLDVTPGDPPQIAVDVSVFLDGETYAYTSPGPETVNVYEGLNSLFVPTATTSGSICGSCSFNVYLRFVDGGSGAIVAWQFGGTDRVSGVAWMEAP